MLRIDQIRLLPGDSEALLPVKCARILRLPAEDIVSCAVLRRAIDAREGLTLVYTAAVEVKQEDTVLRRCRDKRVSRYAPETYALPAAVPAPEIPPIVVGAGPAGLFAALVLARCGARPIVLERGRPVEQRQADVERFWSGGALDTESNVQFGEGGAGAFSDGKLNTGTRDVRHRFIMETLVRCGAPESILTDAKPHVGTDMLHIALRKLRQELTAAGADIRFGARLESLRTKDGALLVNVTAEDFPSPHPLAGIALQRQVEEAAFALGGGDYRAPCQRVEDFLRGAPSTGAGRVMPSYRPGVVYTDMARCLPPFIAETLRLALPVLGKKLKGYDDPDALLTGVETRSSSPVRLVRDDRYEANIRGIYPCGEGAGYAGGILSAAADGMRCAEKLLEVCK